MTNEQINKIDLVNMLNELRDYHYELYKDTKRTNAKNKHYAAYLCCKRILEKVDLL